MTERHDDPALLTGSHALDALSDDERAFLEHVLTTSPELQAETDSLRETALQLAYAVEPVEPPASLKASLMAQIARTPQAAPDEQVAGVPSTATGLEAPLAPATALAPAASPAPVAAPSASSAPVEGRAAAAARRRWFQRPAAALSAAAAVAVVFLGVGLGVGTNFGQSEGTGPETTQASGTLDSIYAASDFQRTTAKVPGGGSATVVWSHDVGKSAVILDGVEQAPEGKTYELWYIGSEGTKVSPAGLVDGARNGVHTAVLEGDLTPGDSIGMTVEPEGGSDQPTSTPLMAVPTTQA
ncbi:anti-sigma factor [Curtobacterium sp. MCSS17_007]|uniref:anti-sigma factor n=1 Tax=Curtobacterium sp. MCSS17_007 TaxID=2175646 RepID=UPI000DA961A0|nr:anti-sigma factor [Curtobacterium sp. MCSS17_007]WIE75344.1 anti-sigma factor [Curtobacterium sp. MCSS17_007]